jgi:hypothetical protein
VRRKMRGLATSQWEWVPKTTHLRANSGECRPYKLANHICPPAHFPLYTLKMALVRQIFFNCLIKSKHTLLPNHFSIHANQIPPP